MSIIRILEEAKEREINREEAVFLFENTKTIPQALELFKTASYVRDREAGKQIRFDGFLGRITPCEIEPPCGFCVRSVADVFTNRNLLTLEEVSSGAKALRETGTSTVELGGGTSKSSAQIIKEAVKRVKEATDLEIWINVGPSLEGNDVEELKNLGVKGVTSSFETINEEIFKKIKPGDSLEKRKKLAELIDKSGLELHSVLMVGLGESYRDRVEHMFYLKKFHNFKYFPITWLHSPKGSPLENYPQPSPWEAARTAAIARLIFRDIHIHISGWQHLQLWLAAGCNRFIHAGASIHKEGKPELTPGFGGPLPPEAIVKKITERLKLVNILPITVKYAQECGLEVEPQILKALSSSKSGG